MANGLAGKLDCRSGNDRITTAPVEATPRARGSLDDGLRNVHHETSASKVSAYLRRHEQAK
jgi:hypothetical protein